MRIEKATQITDAKIQFVSLVDKAANKARLLITKSEDGHADIASYGRIIKADADPLGPIPPLLSPALLGVLTRQVGMSVLVQKTAPPNPYLRTYPPESTAPLGAVQK